MSVDPEFRRLKNKSLPQPRKLSDNIVGWLVSDLRRALQRSEARHG